jgi:hypothetical protein
MITPPTLTTTSTTASTLIVAENVLDSDDSVEVKVESKVDKEESMDQVSFHFFQTKKGFQQ